MVVSRIRCVVFIFKQHTQLSTVGSATSGIAQSVGFDIGSESASVSSFLDVFGSVSVDTETQTETLTQQFVGNTGPTIVASGLPGQGGSYAVTGFLRELGDANSEADLTACKLMEGMEGWLSRLVMTFSEFSDLLRQ